MTPFGLWLCLVLSVFVSGCARDPTASDAAQAARDGGLLLSPGPGGLVAVGDSQVFAGDGPGEGALRDAIRRSRGRVVLQAEPGSDLVEFVRGVDRLADHSVCRVGLACAGQTVATVTPASCDRVPTEVRVLREDAGVTSDLVREPLVVAVKTDCGFLLTLANVERSAFDLVHAPIAQDGTVDGLGGLTRAVDMLKRHGSPSRISLVLPRSLPGWSRVACTVLPLLSSFDVVRLSIYE